MEKTNNRNPDTHSAYTQDERICATFMRPPQKLHAEGSVSNHWDLKIQEKHKDI